MSKQKKKQNENLRINEGIRARELRVLIEGEDSKVMQRDEALALAQEMGLDLIEISANANPPVAKITDYGKFMYDQKKKQKEIKAKQHQVEVKSIQIRLGTGEDALKMKAKMASDWLKQGHRVKAEIYLRGRAKYMDKNFLHDRLGKVLALIAEPYRVVEDYKKSPKGIAILIEPDKKRAQKKEKQNEKTTEGETALREKEEK